MSTSNQTGVPSSPEPVSISYAIGNSYSLLPPQSAPLDHTKRHLKVHDWVLYMDILPGSNPDLVDRVTFDMRDDSFRGLGFTCHCPIRVRDLSDLNTSTTTGDNGSEEQSHRVSGGSVGENTQERKVPSTNPRPRSRSRYRFSTRQQTYGAVDVRITIRGVGGSKSVVDYKILLRSDAPEVYGTFIERRPNTVMRPIKMTDGDFTLRMHFGIDDSSAHELPLHNGVENRTLLQQIAKSIYSRSKRPMKAILNNPCNGESWSEEWFSNKKGNTSINGESNAWTLSFVGSTSISIASPSLVGGDGLNECYKIIEGLPSYLTSTNKHQSLRYTHQDHSLHVQIDVSRLTLPQIIKVCQNFIKYEDAIDTLMPGCRRDNRCNDCLSNKHAMRSDDATFRQLNNKERNNLIAKCTSFQDLISCLNPEGGQHYKLNLRNLINPARTYSSTNNNNITIEFRQHPTSKDKTTTTHWIRFCMAFVKNSARLRAPNALKNTTSIEDEFELLFEYVVKDRALRNFYRSKRDEFAAREEEERLERFAVENATLGDDDMSISDGGSDEESHDLKSNPNLKREIDAKDDKFKSKRYCL